MVLYKRKPVEYAPIPAEAREHPESELWELRETGEIFVEYIDYLRRREFYLERNFTCEITGRSGLTYFDAVTSEHNGTEQIRSQFPKPLRGPILKLVQFSTKGRIEQLVNDVYRTFKKDFYPGESVVCISKNGDRLSGVIREKATYPGNTPDGVAVSFSKYAVSLRSPKHAEPSLFESKDITRDRRSFSKNLIRSFLRDSLTKGAWHGAPWVVKDRLAKELDLPLEVPLHLQQSTKLAEKRALARQRKAVSRAKLRQRQNLSMTTVSDIGGPDAQTSTVMIAAPPTMQKPWQSKPGGKQKHRFIQHDIQTFQPGAQQQFVQLNRVQSNYRTVQYTANGDGHMQAVLLNPGEEGFNRTSSPPLTTLTIQRKEPSPPFVAPVRYPIEDLEISPKDSDVERPPLKFFTDGHISGIEKGQTSKTGKLEEKSVGSLLEVWNTLNVHNEVFILDSFTLDDFAQALCFSSVDVYCELLSEMHCAVLKQLVNDKGQLMVSLPQFGESSDESSDEEEESEQEEEPAADAEPDPDPEPLRRTTRGSLAKAEALALASQRNTTPEAPVVHAGEEFRQSFSWTDLCKDREFKNGGWQTILVGLLYQLSLSDPMKARCDKILSHLIPLGTEPTVETITEQYAALDVNLRLDALAMIVLLAVQTRAIREHLEKMSLEMTELRKRRIEQQRLKKDLADQLQDLDTQKKELSARHEASHTAEEKDKGDEDTPMPDVPQTNGKHDSSEHTDDEAPRLRHRLVIDRKRKREEEAARRAKERKEKAAATKFSKEETKLKKLTTQIDEIKDQIKECEEQILDLNNDLRETDCQRTKCLGRDRFCNRYYWFERNGMPFGGVPRTSTAHYGYANARLWVQGADADERAGFVELPAAEQAAYRARFGSTVPERQRREEGGTSLLGAEQWGYYDGEAAVDALVAWLDERGVRERALRRELLAWRDVIVECMEKLQLHREGEAERLGGGAGDTPKTRISTRTKTYVDLDATRWTCLAWRNSMAIEELGVRHGDGVKRRGRPPKAKIALDRKGRLAGKRGGRGG